MTIEDLAVMVKRGFDQTASKDDLAHGLGELRKEFWEANKLFNDRLGVVEDDVHDIKVALGPLVRVVAALENRPTA